MSEDVEEARRSEDAGRERLRETEADARETLEEAEELDTPSAGEPGAPEGERD